MTEESKMLKITILLGENQERFECELSEKDFALMLEQQPDINYEYTV